MSDPKKKLFLIRLQDTSIFDQLQMEEALLRTKEENYCIFNMGSSDAIVMGNAAKPKEVLNFSHPKIKQIPIIKRFSGGGTVYVDANTLFVSLLFNKSDVSVAPYPSSILGWTAELYQKALFLNHFCLKENDYALGNHKIGGNAQYIRKNRWLHHTTFLWDYEEENMECLSMPPRVPNYRQKRSHKEFLTSLKGLIEKDIFFYRVQNYLTKIFDVEEIKCPETFALHPKTTALV